MAEGMAASCPLCLQPDEAGSMLEVELEHVQGGPWKHPKICMRCAAAIVVATRRLEAEMIPPSSTEEPPEGER